jgi:hypothetical protein
LKFSERDIGRAFKRELEKQKYEIFDFNQRKSYTTRFKVYLNKPVQTHKLKFQKFWKDNNLSPKAIPPSQPEIDMILVDELGIWRAIELKAIKMTEKGVSSSYYHGLGQTLAYFSYGFEEAGLWHCFDGDSMTDREISKYNFALGLIRAPIDRLVDLTFFRILKKEEELKIETVAIDRNNIREYRDGVGIYQPDKGTYLWRCKSYNPFLSPSVSKEGVFSFDEEVVKRVKVVRQFLELQKKKVWDKKREKTS